MANQGYIALHRKLRDNFLWKERRSFSKAEAWIDMLMEAQHSNEPRELFFDMKVLDCHYAQILRSVRSLAKKWNWSRSKVERFLKLLESRGMIETFNEHCVTRITISNYARYDPRKSNENFQSGHIPRHLRDTGETRPGHSRATNNNYKNVNNEDNDKKQRGQTHSLFRPPSSFEVSEYAKTIGFELNGRDFVDFYQAKGWMIGKNKMKDWKASVRTWKKRSERRSNAVGRVYRTDTEYKSACSAEGCIEL
jgi:hypothetical protein